MRERIRNFLVGLASIIALLGLAALLMSFGELDAWFHPRYPVTINTDNASGLREGATIDFNGVPVGVVDQVSTQSDPQFPVKVVGMINEGVQIPRGVRPYSVSSLLGATSILQFRVVEKSTEALPTDGSAVISASMRGGLLSELTEQLDKRMEPLMKSLERFNKLSDTFVALGENLNSMMEPQTAQDIEQGAQPNVRTAVLKLNDVLEQAQHGLRLANEFLGDEQMRADAQQAIHKATALIDQASTAVDNYTQLARTLQTNADDFTKHALPVMDDLSATLEEVRRVASAVSEGKGTAGQLVTNPDLYNSLNDAATRLNRTLVEMQVLIQQLRAEGFMLKF